ncbi:SPX domain-containing protein 1-like isoform X1 [Hibiscus syriacus]|uniref:SPX domain-containing protein 1-like isoform X1 n=1 Tax=Hibiscus syriacus TaxID=106335 RepID=UPI001923F343|nr:SPX domain-containing protein 1-like isoform X1 [Hibiscus syriacus]
MKHGKRHRAEVARSLPQWERKFLAYKALKRKLKLANPNSNGRNRPRDMGFKQSLNRELDKVNTFYLDKEEDYIIMFRELESRAENLNGNEEMLELRRELLDFYSEMVMLLHYSVINFTGTIHLIMFYLKTSFRSNLNICNRHEKKMFLTIKSLKQNRVDEDCEEAQQTCRWSRSVIVHA